MMRRQEIGEVALRIMGLFAAFYGVVYVLLAVILPWTQEDIVAAADAGVIHLRGNVVRGLVGGGLYLVGGAVLIVLARPISRRLAGAADEPAGEGPFDLLSPQGFRFVLKIIGIYLLILAITSAANCASELARWWRFSAHVPWISIHLFDLIGKLLVAAYLIRGAKWLTRFAWGRESVVMRHGNDD